KKIIGVFGILPGIVGHFLQTAVPFFLGGPRAQIAERAGKIPEFLVIEMGIADNDNTPHPDVFTNLWRVFSAEHIVTADTDFRTGVRRQIYCLQRHRYSPPTFD